MKPSQVRIRLSRLSLMFILLFSVFYSFSFSQGEENEEVNSLMDAKISVPWNDFKQLLDKIKRDTVENEAEQNLPAQYVISDAQINGKPQNEHECEFTVNLIVSVLDPQSYIEIPLGRGLQIFPDVTINGKSGSIGMREDGTAFVFLHGKGAFKVIYRYLVPVSYNSGKFTVTFPLPGQAAARISMDLGGKNFSVQANDRPLSMNNDNKARVTYDGGLGNCTDAIITWQQTISSTGNKDAMVSSSLNTMYSIAADVVKVSSQLNFTIVHNSIRQFSFSVPSSVDIIDVSGNSVATWETRDTAQIKIVTAYLKYDVKDNVSFLVHAEMSYSDSAAVLELPPVTMLHVTRQEGLIGIGVLSSIEINPYDHSNNVLMRDKREIPEWFSDQGDIIHVYQYLSDNYRIALNLTRHKNISVLNALITSANIQSMIREDGKMVSTMDLVVRNRGEQFLRLQWNKDYQLWSVYCNNKPTHPSLDSASNELLIPVDRTNERTTETPVRITFLSLQKALKNFQQVNIEYPKFNMPVQNLRGSLFLPQQTRVIMRRGALPRTSKNNSKPWFSSLFIKKEYREIKDESDSMGGLSSAPEGRMEEKRGEFNSKVKSRRALEYTDMKNSSIVDLIMQQRDFEAGVLSIPVEIHYEGLKLPFSVSIIKKDDPLKLSFFQFKISVLTKKILETLVFLLMCIASIVVTVLFSKGFSFKHVLFWIVLPVSVALILKRLLLDSPLNIDLLFIIPSIYACFKVYKIINELIKNHKWASHKNDTGDYQGVNLSTQDNKPAETGITEE